MSKDVMNAKELAAYLGLAEATVYKYAERRDIPFTKVGSLLRFPKWIIDRWLAERATRPIKSLYDEFALLQQRYHLKQFLASKGLDYEQMSEEQLETELKQAIKELKAAEDQD